jgi:hypothetical protein
MIMITIIYYSLFIYIIIIYICAGALQFTGVKGRDVFVNESEAVAYLKANYQLKNAMYGSHRLMIFIIN